MSAMDGVNQGIGVWNRAVETMAQSMGELAREREQVKQMEYHNQLNGWKNYAGRLETHIKTLEEKIINLNDNHQSLIANYIKTKKEDNVYIDELISRFNYIDTQLFRNSGRSHLNARMRDFLFQNLVEAVGKDKSKEIYDQMAAKERLDGYWKEYENAGDPRMGIPLKFEMSRSILSNGDLIPTKPVPKP